MICPECGAPEDSTVLNCRDLLTVNCKRRRRKCLYCGHRFTTYEFLDTDVNKYKKKGWNKWELMPNGRECS